VRAYFSLWPIRKFKREVLDEDRQRRLEAAWLEYAAQGRQENKNAP
jgi:hypothetical protein